MEKKARKRILLFLAGLVLINFAATIYFYKVSIRNFKVVRYDNQFWKKYKGEELVIMGHSRPAKAYDKRQLTNSIQYCSSAESIEKTYYKLKSLLTKRKPEVIIIPAGYAFVAMDKAEYAIADFFWRRHLDFFELAKLTNKPKEYYSRYIKSLLFPYHRYPYVKLKDFNDEALVRFRDNYPEMDDSKKQEMAEKIVSFQSRNKALESKSALLYLDMLIDLAKENDVQLVFVKYPITKYYEKSYLAQKEAAGLEKNSIEKIVIDREDEDIYYFDLTHSLDHCPECFKDVQHMNETGAIEFTSMMSELLKNELGIKL